MNTKAIDLAFNEHHQKPHTAIAIGSVEDVIAGRVADALKEKLFKASDYLHGFELASPESLASMGEAVLTNGICYSHDTSHNQRGLLLGEDFFTSGMFLLDKTSQPNLSLNIECVTSPLAMGELYAVIEEQVKQPFAFAGLIEFANLHSTCIEKAPVSGDNIFAHKDMYYPSPPFDLAKQASFIVAVACNFSQLSGHELSEKLKVVLYQNPFEREQQSLSMHAHCCLLNTMPADKSSIQPAMVTDVHHVINDGSTIAKASLDIFIIGDVLRT